MRAAGLERHHERLAAGVHDRVRELVRPRADAGQDLDADQGAGLGSGVAPGAHAGLHRGQQHIRVDVRVLDAQLRAERGHLGAGPAVRTGLAEVEAGAAHGFEGGEAVGRGGLPVGLGVLGVRGPVGAASDGGQRLFQGGPVLGGQLGGR
ncbi:hypothetical protein GCM10020254_43180 [Streptomyces goshikiensis]